VHFTRSIRLAIVLVMASGAAVLAQDTGAPRGFLFGAGGGDVNSRNSLGIFVDMSVSSVSDSGLAGALPIGDADFLVHGLTSQLTTSADYARARRRTLLMVNGSTSFIYFSSLDRVSPVSHAANLRWAARLPRRSTLRLSSSAAYTPAYLYELFPTASASDADELIAANPDYRILRTPSYSYGAKAALRLGSDKNLHVMTSVEKSRTEFDQGFLMQPDLSTSEARVQLIDPVSGRLSWSVDYGHGTATYGVAGKTNADRISGAVEYSYALSRTHRLRFRLNVGPGILHVPADSVFASLPSLAPPPDQNRPEAGQTIRLYELESDATIDVDLGSRLRGSVNYRRGTEYLALLTQPVFADAVRADMSGLITRRVEWSASGGYATGTSALNQTADGLRTTTAQFRTRYALSRSLAAYAEYLHYWYDLRDQSPLAPGLPHLFKRHEIRFGGMLIVRPIHTKGRTR